MNKPSSYWIEALRDRTFIGRCNAARALADLGPEAWDAVPALIQALKDREAAVRDAAAAALGAIGPAAQAAVMPLMESLYDANAFVRKAAAGALKNIDPDHAVEQHVNNPSTVNR